MNSRHEKNRLHLTLPLLLLLTLLCSTMAQATGLRIIYANDILGELDSCG
jgi:hypothetical protein